MVLKIALPLMLLLFSLSIASAEVTKEDLREMEQRIKEYVDLKMGKLETRIDGMDKRLTAEIEMVIRMVGVLIVIIVAILAIPQAISFVRERREIREVVELRERITALEKQLSKV